MLADLFNADDPSHACGTSTIGSSEAILLGGLAMKRRWMARRKAEGKSCDKPNIVMGSEVHVRRLSDQLVALGCTAVQPAASGAACCMHNLLT